MVYVLSEDIKEIIDLRYKKPGHLSNTDSVTERPPEVFRIL
jgi:hypothetical protein